MSKGGLFVPVVAILLGLSCARGASAEETAATAPANSGEHTALKDSEIKKKWTDAIAKLEELDKKWIASGKKTTPVEIKDTSGMSKEDKKLVEAQKKAVKAAEEAERDRQKAARESEKEKKSS
jgi:hypothetical protein